MCIVIYVVKNMSETGKIMLFKLSRPQRFINILECVEALNDEATLRFTENELHILEVDKTHEAMVELKLPSDAFDSWHGYEGNVSVNLTTMLKVLGKITKDDELKVYLIPFEEQGHNPKLEFVIRGAKSLTRAKKMGSLEPIDDEVPQPKIFFKSATRIVTDALKFAIEDLKETSHICLTSTSEGLEFSTIDDMSSNSTKFRKGDDNTIDHRLEEDSKATYSTEYLVIILKVINRVAEATVISISNNMPIKIDAEMPKGTLTYYIAPIILD